MTILVDLGTLIYTSSPTGPLRMLLSTTLAILKKGTMSGEFCRKMIEGIKADLGLDITLEIEDVRQIYQAYGQYTNSAIVRNLVGDWLEWTPSSALRIRLTLQQSAEEGLTGLTTITKTVTTYPDFLWEQLACIPGYSGEEPVLHNNGSGQRLPPDPNSSRRLRKDRFHNIGRSLRVPSNAFRTRKRTSHVPTPDGPTPL